MNPKPVYQLGLLACIVILLASCRTTQSATYNDKAAVAPKAQSIQLPNTSQELQVEVVTPGNKSTEKKQ